MPMEGWVLGWAKMPGLAGTMLTATALVTWTLPSLRTARTTALMLVVSATSQGIWAMTVLGETLIRGAMIPLKYTCVPPSSLGSTLASLGAVAVWKVRVVSGEAWMVTSELGAIC